VADFPAWTPEWEKRKAAGKWSIILIMACPKPGELIYKTIAAGCGLRFVKIREMKQRVRVEIHTLILAHDLIFLL
jgi:hypothetical protein